MQKSLTPIHILFAMVAASILLSSCGAPPTAPSQEVILEGVQLHVAAISLNKSFPADCTGAAPACMQAQPGNNILSVTFQPRDLPEGQMLAYKNLPVITVILRDGEVVKYSLSKYDNTAHTLTLGFEVPEGAADFRLKWADQEEIPLIGLP